MASGVMVSGAVDGEGGGATVEALIPDTGELVEIHDGRLALPGKVSRIALELPDSISREDWLGIGEQLKGVERSLMWWVGDWLRYGERRWGEMYSQALDATEHAYHTLSRAKVVATRFEQIDRRRSNLTWSHHAEVAFLDPHVADRLLDCAEGECWSTRDLRAEVHRLKDVVGQVPGDETCTVADLFRLAESGRRYSTIYADPPWLYGNQGTRAATGDHYDGMTVSEIAALPVPSLLTDSAHLHLWTTNGFLFDARRIIEAWGFEYKSCFVWVKPQIGMGNYWRVAHEFLLLGIRGDDAPFRKRDKRSWAELRRGKHSAKPHQIRMLIEEVSPGPYLELFARRPTKGWAVWGNMVDRSELFTHDVPEVA